MKTRGIVSILATLLLALAPLAVNATDTNEPAKAAYLRYCSACHGEDGRGDGVVSHLMRPRPTNLTRLTNEKSGTFPYAWIIRVIDGRDTLRAHGDPTMPVWGDLFRAEAGMTWAQQAEARGKVLLITEHLSTIQEK